MTIGIDARLYEEGGIGRYTREFIQNLELIDAKNNYIIFLCKDSFDLYQPKNSRFKKVLVKSRWYTLGEQVFFLRILYKYKLDLVHFLHFSVPILYRRPFIVTIHDILLFKFFTTHVSTKHPLVFYIKYLGYKLVVGVAIKRAKKVITVSNYNKREILQHFKIDSDKIVVIYEGIANSLNLSNSNSDLENAFLAKLGIKKPYFLYVGSAYPHKNLKTLLLVFKMLADEGCVISLVCVGKIDYFYKILYDRIRVLNLEKVVILTDFLDDSNLSIVYRNAYAYITTSLYEGFGLPSLEAMANNIPVLVSDIDIFREVLRDCALFFSNTDIDQIVLSIKDVLQSNTLRASLINRGKSLVAEYDFLTMTKKIILIYNQYAGSDN